ncbi:NDR1/HIN1-like protein 1 [Phoenix dactylifera]|uniref:NDR1/HIN1-like protein 1 n=1 Tax=Phoenix dactylifera TaxID=42345 RepID=A0A8B7BRX5_PHODC|nr:NDR1/HIN1-like protein 1 [Phoenix dactylifera]
MSCKSSDCGHHHHSWCSSCSSCMWWCKGDDCHHHSCCDDGSECCENVCGIIFCWILAFIILILFIILIIWLVLRPTKPKFYLQDATIVSFNVSSPENLVSATLQVTISTRNPNDRIGIYYDRVDVFASYKYQQITPATAVPPFYQGHNDIDLWSPFLCGVNVPVAPYLAEAIAQDQSSGVLLLHVKIDGRLRWKVGTWTSGHYHLFVTCPAFLSFELGKGDGDPSAIKFQQISTCTVDV